MDWLIAIIVATVVWIVTPLWEVPVSYVVERVFTRSRLDLGKQLRGLTFSILAAPISALTLMGGQRLLTALNVDPLLDIKHTAWASDHPIMLVGLLVALAVVGGDFLYYWAHRAQHAWPLLWRFHSMHHSTTDLSGLNNYAHWSEEAVQIAFIIMPLALLMNTNSGSAGAIAGALLLLHHRYIHSTSRLNLGAWSWLINDNRRHRIHHSIEPAHFDRNFSITFGFWDHLFGTAYVPRRDEWPDTGLADMREPEGIGEFFAWSFMSVEDPLLASAPGVGGASGERSGPSAGREVELID
jgi:sterol desaturase/sphingolipid hydroxylase (fatty acid hydroxylase superfamily)